MSSTDHSKKPELKFQPLTDGLGFHPFSDGLPYAPVVKSQTSKVSSAAASAAGAGATSGSSLRSGTGAVAAGRPMYSPPSPQKDFSARTPSLNTFPTPAPRIQTPRISVPVASQAHFQAQAPRTQATPQTVLASQSAISQNNVTAATAPTAEPAPLFEPTYGMGYLMKRVLAYLLDSAFNLALCAAALSAALWKQDLSPELLLNPGVVLVASIFLGVFNWAITTAQEVAFGTSIGKRIFGLGIQGSTSAIFLRSFFFLPSVFFAGIGLIWSVFDKRKRCWHDLVVDVQPMEIARL